VPDAEWLPSNRNEALQVLGASSETAHDILKKTVRTLRQTWHPDLARREEERRVRGLRLKQINVAWDIICGKQASA
jgi:preprotein translocase subunit Sec63